MSANTAPVFIITPNVSGVKIGTTSAQVKSDGTSAGSGTDLMYVAWVAGANGGFVSSIRFTCVATSASTNSVATVLRVYRSTAGSLAVGSAAGATTAANTMILTEISVPIVPASGSISVSNYFDVPINRAIPAGHYLVVSQHIAQTTNQNWQAQVFGGDY